MSSTKILYICQEITPYLPETEMSTLCRKMPQAIQEKGCEIRTFMPKYGLINERRNQLHEVIRLSGMNLIINDNDHPLIIKVASIQSARMQIYFIDNDDLFHRKFITTDADGKEFADNDDRSIFFVRGVIETVRKLRWVPDIIHCNGWMSALTALYVRKALTDDPFFKNAKIVYSIYNDAFQQPLSADFAEKVLIEGVAPEDLGPAKDLPTWENVTRMAASYSDGLILVEPASKLARQIATQSGKPFIVGNEDDNYDNYAEFYKTLTEPEQ